jgi:hypothetical protein
MAKTAKQRLENLRLRAAQVDLSDEKGRRIIFQYYKEAGYLPAKDAQGHAFNSFEDIVNFTQRRVNSLKQKYPNKSYGELLRQVQAQLVGNRGFRSAKASKDLLIAADSIKTSSASRTTAGTGYTGPPIKIDSKTGTVSLDKRKYMSADGGLPPPVYDELASKYGKVEADKYQAAVRKEWDNMNLQARELGERTGIEFHRGHWLSNKYGGAESGRAGSLEIAKPNQAHGAADRGNIKAVQETGLASNGWLDDYYQWRLSNEDLSVSGVKHLNQADLQAISNGANIDKLIAQRELEFFDRGGVPDNDSIGMIFGSQLGRDQTINQHVTEIHELNLRASQDTGINPQTGNPIRPDEKVDLSRKVRSGISQNTKNQNLPRNVLAEVPTGSRQLAETLDSVPPTGTLRFQLPKLPDMPANVSEFAKQVAKPVGQVAGVVGAALPILDAADVYAGTTGAADSTKSKGDRLASTFQAVSGSTGLASLNPAVAPITAPISVATGALAAATQRRADMDKPKPKPDLYGAAKPAEIRPLAPNQRASLKPTPNVAPRRKSPMEVIGNELEYAGRQALKIFGL